MDTVQQRRPPSAPQHSERRTRVRGPRAKAAAAAQLDFLARLTQDAHDLTTPVGAFLAALPQPLKRQTKSSSERGRAFRERQHQREDELEHHIEKLKREIVALDLKRKARETRCLNHRTGLSGSLVQTIREYHHLFTHGLQECPPRPATSVFHATAIVGNMVGPEASIMQWRRYTQSHATMTAFVTGVDVLVTHDDGNDGDDGNDDDIVTVVALCVLRVRLSRETFKMMFPHVLSNETFLQRLVGKEVTYDAVKRFQFSSEGRIVTETVDVDFVSGLMKAGCSLADISTLMSGAAITPDRMIVEVAEEYDAVATTRDDEWITDGHAYTVKSLPPLLMTYNNETQIHNVDDYAASPPTNFNRPATEPLPAKRLSMAFLLSDDSDLATNADDASQAARPS